MVVAATVGLLVNRRPPESGSLPAMTARASDGRTHESERTEESFWTALFRPGLPTARQMLRRAVPALAVRGPLGEPDDRVLRFLWTGPGPQRPQTLFQAALPFLRPGALPEEPMTVDPSLPAGESPGPEPRPSPPAAAEAPFPRPEPGATVLNDGLPLVGIYHTHDYEAYISEFPDLAVTSDQDLQRIASYDHSKRTIVDIGAILARRLRDLGVTTVHAPFKHQELGYEYAYQSSRNTARRILREAPTVKVLMDLHRDGNMDLDSTVWIDGQPVARVRCVIGVRDDLTHWQENLAFCNRLMEKMEEANPGITLPTLTPQARYNQDLLPGAILLEIGNALNTFEEAERAVYYLADALVELLRAGEYPGK
ncbi:stage II sporulation protein P [Symbiobacterium thermophilum IAM 14863]|uniref:Stage II sporulation protein P n=1 Tax=Symbiobacterium thermophilum (strain DSM 24528 / JCM 14929 / IAM 14863 / T) TaxID=292459 RepID=Q67S77_SYMTH|nr:stage II sporulation protein P [Symbiobacterium thermophilum IAM 14863]